MDSTMKDFLDEYDVKRIQTGDILKGKVIEVNDKEVAVNINYAFDGLITKEELTHEGLNPLEVVNKGDEIEVYVLSPNDGEGYVSLSRIKALNVIEKQEIKDAYENNTNISVKVKEEVKGGLVAYYGGIRVFIPGSLASRERIELSNLIGKDLEIKIIELDFRNRKIVGSRKVIEEEIFNKKKKEQWANIKAGEKVTGVVTKIVKYGAFVDIGNIQGLIHLNDLSWERVYKAEDVVSVGDKVEVFISEVDRENEKISLVLKDVEKEPWKVHGDSIKENSIFEGKVVRLAAFGAFVEILPGIEGLVHISEITDDNIAKPSDVLKVGDKIKVKVLMLDKENKKLSLSIKEAIEGNKEYEKYNDSDEGVSLGELFKNLKL
ncbi:MAG: 30S ribosomal protein S1 [Clostridiales bacterium]|mgnify:CR=1 FL=1|nr:30S ribosomal protein S1 [Clostridiales bacterium]